MNLVEELQTLDWRDPGRWPLAVRAGAVALCFVLVSAIATYIFVYDSQVPELQKREDTEQQLRQEFKAKHAKAVNLEVYKQQLKDIERSFGALLRQLPGKTEVPTCWSTSRRPACRPASKRSCSSRRPNRRRISTQSCPSRSVSRAAITSSASS